MKDASSFRIRKSSIYDKKSKTMIWASKNLYINKDDGTDAGKNSAKSRFYGTVDECKTKCDSFTNCKSFTYLSINPARCWFYSSNDLSDTNTTNSRKYDFYYTSSNPTTQNSNTSNRRFSLPTSVPTSSFTTSRPTRSIR